MRLEEVLAPASKLAGEGFQVGAELARNADKGGFEPSTQRGSADVPPAYPEES